MRSRSEVHVATPQPKKSVSSVQIGHRSASAQASRDPEDWPIGEFEKEAREQFHQTAQRSQKDERFLGIAPRLTTRADKCSSASANADSGTKEKRLPRASRSLRVRASRERHARGCWRQPPALCLAFRFFSRAARRIRLYSSISSSSFAPHETIISSRSLAAARIASSSAVRLRFCAGI